MIKSKELASPNSCLNKAADDEMMFVLRAKDPAAPAAILAWIAMRVILGLNKVDDPKLVEAADTGNEMARQREAGKFDRPA